MVKRVFSVILAISMALIVLPLAASAASKDLPFQDVSGDDWFRNAVLFVNDKALMTGVSSTQFAPSTELTRAMLVTVLYKLDGEPDVTYAAIYEDVPAGQWYSKAITWASECGIVTGYGDGKFGTNDKITREQLAATFLNYAQHKGYDTSKRSDLSAFTDAGSVSSWALEGMKWLVASGIITGVTETMLEPRGNSNRAQCAAFLMKFIHKFEGEDSDIFYHVNGIDFAFSSGVGAWATLVELYADGTFTGYFYDADMGDSGPNYPYGTRYECEFEGRFTVNKRIDEFTYSLKLEEMNVKGTIGEVNIVEGVRVITSDAYGFDNADEFKLYLPGRKTADLPEEFIMWVRMPTGWGDLPETLPFYGLYNTGGQEGFFS